MTHNNSIILMSVLLFQFTAFAQIDEVATPNKLRSSESSKPSDFENNGKLDSTLMAHLFEKDTTLSKVVISNWEQVNRALHLNMSYLLKKGSTAASPQKSLPFTYADVRKSNTLLQMSTSDTIDFSQLHLHKIWGGDQMGNVQFTSYYIPIIEVSREKDSIYKYPIYKAPNSTALQGLTRAQIDQKNLLAGKNLEIAYAKNYFDVYSMQVQGSGYVKFEDGTEKLLSYGGKNNKSYLSIGKYLVEAGHISKELISMQSIKSWFASNPDSLGLLMKNASYVFFRETHQEPSGAAGVPLIDFVSIATDFNYLPKGALLLGEIPVLDAAGNFVKHEYRILMVHDTGGAIKGAGRVDLYAGIGHAAGEYAGRMKHFGRLWMILPR